MGHYQAPSDALHLLAEGGACVNRVARSEERDKHSWDLILMQP
jgi:hypothetical protein